MVKLTVSEVEVNRKREKGIVTHARQGSQAEETQRAPPTAEPGSRPVSLQPVSGLRIWRLELTGSQSSLLSIYFFNSGKNVCTL